MALSSRIRRHLQSHVVGYLALFVALSGTALALPGQKTVKGKDIANGAVKKRAIAGGAVVSGKLAGGAVTSAKLAAGAVGATQLADNAVERKKLKAQAVAGSKIADGAVTTQKVADASLLGDDFAPGQISDAFVFPTDFGQTFSIQRAGRVYVVATVLTDCATAPCHYAVDDRQFPGRARGDLARPAGGRAAGDDGRDLAPARGGQPPDQARPGRRPADDLQRQTQRRPDPVAVRPIQADGCSTRSPGVNAIADARSRAPSAPAPSAC